MIAMSERVNAPIPTHELERRWLAVRSAMEAAGIDVLVCQANQDFMGGYVKWFTDIPATQGYTEIVVFPRDAPMTMIGQGPFGGDRAIAPEGDGIRRGVGRVLTAAIYASAGYSHAYDAELAATALAPYARGTVGLVGLSTLSHHLVETLKTGALAGATFVDASDMVDRIKAIKSADEIALIRATAQQQDRAMVAAFDAFRPGARDRDVTAAAEYLALKEGSEQGLYMCASAPAGSPAFFANRHFQNRVIQPGDQMAILIENSGAGGFYCEIGRTAVLGSAADAMHRGIEFVLKARTFMLERLRPGASCPQIWDEYNAFMRDHGRPEEDRLHCHSMGYDLVERPLVRFDEPMMLAANMVVSCHPTFTDDDGLHWLCDNFVILEDRTERLHGYAEAITEIH